MISFASVTYNGVGISDKYPEPSRTCVLFSWIPYNLVLIYGYKVRSLHDRTLFALLVWWLCVGLLLAYIKDIMKTMKSNGWIRIQKFEFKKIYIYFMMTSSNGNIFRVTGPLCGEFTSHRWIPRNKTSHAELWYFLWSAPESTVQ